MDRFTSEDIEYFHVIIHLMENILKTDKKIILTLDTKLFNKYVKKPIQPDSEWGGCIRESGMVWLNEKDLAKRERAFVVSILIHEILHIKYPKKPETWIESTTSYYINAHNGIYK